MGTSGSSSKRKSSSSLKKKRSKNASEVRRRKRSRSRSRRNKSKKLRRRDASISYPDEDDSRSSVSYSSSGSEGDYRKRRSRSCTRRYVKGSRKRARRSSSSQESSRDSFRARKRKRSKRKRLKRNGNSDVRKKTYKKPRRDVSVSSTSSGSWSCSTCHGGSSSDGSEFERPRRKSEREERDKKNEGKVESGIKRSRYRSRSCSSCSKSSSRGGYQSEDRFVVDNNSRRLRSVITVVNESEEKEGRELGKDEGEEEMIYDHDDYPCRSGDSNDGGSKRELTYHSYVASEKRRRVENVKGLESVVFKITTTEVPEGSKDGGNQYEGRNPNLDGVGANNPFKESKSDVSAASPNVDDLESILRQKALENLRKFRGGLQTNAKTSAEQKDKGGSDVKHLSTAKAELVQSKPPKEDDVRVIGTAKAVDQVSMPKMVVDSTNSSQNEGKIPDMKRSVIKSAVAKQDIVSRANRGAVSGNSKEKMNMTAGAITDKSELGTPALRRESSGISSTLTTVPTSHTSPRENLLVNKSSLDNNAVKTTKIVPKSGSNHIVEVNNACDSAVSEPSCLKSTPAEGSTKEPQDETKEGSQFEQKTMSVMRGGEMVQVSYKVYIPKKAPALARRQLQR